MPELFGYRSRWDGPRVRVRVEVPELAAAVAGFYPDRRCPPPPGERARRIVIRRAEGADYEMWAPSGVWRAREPGELVALFEAELTDVLCERSDRYVRLHGSAVDVSDEPVGGPGRCVLLLGGSGAGKSSLTLGLAAAGGRPVSDDLLLMEPSGRRLEPFDRSIRVHRDALSALDIATSAIPGARYVDPYLWVEPGTLERPGDPAKPAVIVFLEPGAGVRLERLAVPDSLRRLLVARYGPGRPVRDFDALRQLAQTTPAYRLSSGRLDGALERLVRLTGLSRSPTARAGTS